MKKIKLLCLLLIGILLFGFLPSSVSAEDVSITEGCRGFDAAAPLLGPERRITNVKGVILYEWKTDTLMYEENADTQLYPASLVKIMTAMLALERADLKDTVVVSAQALTHVDPEATSIRISEGEVFQLEQLLYAMMVESANDAASVIGDFISGSQEAFVVDMNERAKELGCTGTNFVNPSGLHDDAQVTTARDMARILANAMKNPDFRKIFGTTHYYMEETNKSAARILSTGNHMMHNDLYEIYYDGRVTGGRTGLTRYDDRCIAVCAESNGINLISIVMGSRSEYTEDLSKVKRIGGFHETSALLDMGFTGYKTAQLLYEGQALKQYKIANGTSDLVIGPQVSISSVLPQSATPISLTYQYNDIQSALQAPIQKGDKVSSVEIWCGGICVAYADLYAMNTVTALAQSQDAGRSKDMQWLKMVGMVLVVVLVVLAILFLILKIIATIRNIAAQKRSRRYRRNRRRSR